MDTFGEMRRAYEEADEDKIGAAMDAMERCRLREIAQFEARRAMVRKAFRLMAAEQRQQ